MNNCSLGEISDNGQNYQYGEVRISPAEFVDDVAGINDGITPAVSSNSRICYSQDLKRLKFSHEKCKLLKINTSDQQQSLQVNGKEMEVKDSFRYLGDTFSSKADNMAMTEERIKRSVGLTIEFIFLCKEVQFGDSQINNMILLYHSIFLPRLIYNCEAWSNISENDYKQLQNAQLAFLRRVMEVNRSTPVAATFLELGTLLIRYEIEKRQLLFLKRILSREACSPLIMTYEQMLRLSSEPNWANGVLDLRQKYIQSSSQ